MVKDGELWEHAHEPQRYGKKQGAITISLRVVAVVAALKMDEAVQQSSYHRQQAILRAFGLLLGGI